MMKRKKRTLTEQVLDLISKFENIKWKLQLSMSEARKQPWFFREILLFRGKQENQIMFCPSNRNVKTFKNGTSHQHGLKKLDFKISKIEAYVRDVWKKSDSMNVSYLNSHLSNIYRAICSEKYSSRLYRPRTMNFWLNSE